MLSRVLLSGAGGAGTIEIIRTLKETGRYRIVAIDASPYAFGLKLADVGCVVPFATDPEFKGVIENIMHRERPDYIIPLVDEEILAFHALAERFDARVLAPLPQFCRLALDKWLTYQSLRNVDIPVPETWPGTKDPDKIDYPAIVKPRFSRGSRGFAYLPEAEDLRKYLQNASEPPHKYIIQSFIGGKEFTVSVAVGLDGAILAVVPKEVVTKRGITLVGITRRSPAIESLCRNIQEKLRADGPFNVQLIMGDNGKPYVIEINPRYSTTVALTIAAGVHEVDLVIRHAQGEPVHAPIDFTPNMIMIRYYIQEYIPETQWPFSHLERGKSLSDKRQRNE